MIDTLGYGRDDRRLLALAEESYGVHALPGRPRGLDAPLPAGL